MTIAWLQEFCNNVFVAYKCEKLCGRLEINKDVVTDTVDSLNTVMFNLFIQKLKILEILNCAELIIDQAN